MNQESYHCVDQFIASPNYDERPCKVTIDTLVIHAISLPPDHFGGKFVESFFTNQLDKNAHPYFIQIHTLQVSAHFYIKRSGEVIQFVNTTSRAWHAGESYFDGKAKVNDFSIGIEMEGCDSQPFEKAQYKKLATLTKEIISTYPLISKDRIIGHSEVSPGRKTDPGPCFNWKHYFDLLTI